MFTRYALIVAVAVLSSSWFGSKAQACIPELSFTNSTGQEAHDLYIKFNTAVTIDDRGQFTEDMAGNGLSTIHHLKGAVIPANDNPATDNVKENVVTISVQCNGKDIHIKEWYWTNEKGKKIREEKLETRKKMCFGPGNAEGDGEVDLSIQDDVVTYVTPSGAGAMAAATSFLDFLDSQEDKDTGLPLIQSSLEQVAPSQVCVMVGKAVFGDDTPDIQLNIAHFDDGMFMSLSDIMTPPYQGPIVINTIPSDGLIDARQPSAIDSTAPQGIDHVVMMFHQPVSTANWQHDFAAWNSHPIAPDPQIVFVQQLGPQQVRVQFAQPIMPEAWTTVAYGPSGQSVTIGFLPGDVTGDGTSNVADVLKLIDGLNNVVSLPPHASDIDRSGTSNAGDVLRLIDLLNGAGIYPVFNGATLP